MFSFVGKGKWFQPKAVLCCFFLFEIVSTWGLSASSRFVRELRDWGDRVRSLELFEVEDEAKGNEKEGFWIFFFTNLYKRETKDEKRFLVFTCLKKGAKIDSWTSEVWGKEQSLCGEHRGPAVLRFCRRFLQWKIRKKCCFSLCCFLFI